MIWQETYRGGTLLLGDGCGSELLESEASCPRQAYRLSKLRTIGWGKSLTNGVTHSKILIKAFHNESIIRFQSYDLHIVLVCFRCSVPLAGNIFYPLVVRAVQRVWCYVQAPVVINLASFSAT